MQNIKQLRDNLIKNYDQLSANKINVKEARTFAELSSKIMSSCKLEMAYANHHGKTVKIQFLESK